MDIREEILKVDYDWLLKKMEEFNLNVGKTCNDTLVWRSTISNAKNHNIMFANTTKASLYWYFKYLETTKTKENEK